MNKYTKEELLKAKFDTLTMKDLRRFVNSNPQIKDSTRVLCERIEDTYFEGADISGMNSTNGILPEGSKFYTQLAHV